MLRLFIFSLVFLSPAIANAACTAPDGVAGQIVYNVTHKKMQFCDGTIWKSMGASSQTINALEDIADVKTPIAATEGQILTWDNTNGEWIAADGVTSYQIPDDASVCDATTDGTIRYNSQKLQVCVNGNDWTDVAGSGVTNGKFVDGTDPNEAVYTTGNVGIGTNDPDEELTVVGDTKTGTLIITGMSGAAPASAPTNLKVPDNVLTCDANRDGTLRYNTGSIQVCINGTDWVDVGSAEAGTAGAWNVNGSDLYYNSGNVGIGTDSPTRKLEVSSGAAWIYPNTDGSEAIALSLGQFDTTTSSLFDFIVDDATGDILNINSNRWASSVQFSRSSADGDQSVATVFGNDGDQRIDLFDGTTETVDVRLSSTANSWFNGDGNVGIGTTGPGSALHVVKEDVGNYVATITNDAANAGHGLQINSAGGGTGSYILDAVGDYDAGTPIQAMRILGNGNVGIGTTSPIVTLHVAEDTAASTNWSDTQLRLTGATNPNQRLVLGYDTTADKGVIQAGNAGVTFEELLLNPNGGNIGIGTTNPAAKLEVDGGVADFGLLVRSDDAFAGAFFKDDTATNIVGVGAHGNNLRLVNGPSAETRMTLDSSGNVGIGTTNPQTPLHVGVTNFSDSRYYNGAIAVENGIPSLVLVDTDGTTWLDHNNANQRSWWWWTGSNWSRQMYLTTTGALWIGSALTQNSDRRLKEGVETIPNALDKVAALRGITYHWKDRSISEKSQLGLIAQEVEDVFPQLVGENSEGTKTLNYNGLIAPLVEAVKELKAANDDLAARVEAQSKEIEALKSIQN